VYSPIAILLPKSNPIVNVLTQKPSTIAGKDITMNTINLTVLLDTEPQITHEIKSDKNDIAMPYKIIVPIILPPLLHLATSSTSYISSVSSRHRVRETAPAHAYHNDKPHFYRSSFVACEWSCTLLACPV
jgi:hypothetical protein